MFTLAHTRLATRLAALTASVALMGGALAACGSSASSEGSTSPSGAGSSTGHSSASGDAAVGSTAGSDGSTGSSTGSSADGSSDGQAGSSTAAGSDAPSTSDVTLTIYSGQHESLVKDLIHAFKEQTGIDVKLRSGEGAELANQVIEEGSGSPADIFLSEEPGPIGMLANKGLLSTVTPSTMKEVDQRLVPSSGDWMPYAARSRVIFYNPKLIKKSELPHSILDLTNAKWKGKFAYAPSGAFVSTVSYLIHDIGKSKTEAWLKGIKANGVNEQHNGKVRDTVEAGQHAFGLSNHYYWWILANQKGGPDKLTSKIYYFDHPDAGGLLLASGAGVVKASKHQAEAQKFLAWLGSADGGQKIIASDPAAQYPVAPGVTSKVGLQPLADLHPPKVDQSIFADVTQARKLIIDAGIS